MRLYAVMLAAAILSASPALPQQQQDTTRQLRAIPSLAEQRNTALNAVAVCAGDVQELQAELAAVDKERESLRALLDTANKVIQSLQAPTP